MPDERTYGFNKDDAQSLLQSIGNGESWFPEIKPRGRGGSGGGHTIWFTITDVLCPDTDYVSETTLVATATYYNQSCTGTPPGAEYGGDYYVYDICNYLYGLTPQDLVGTTGRATYMYPLTGACTPKWIIDDLCAQPECD
jgi:hypothetical protein